MPPKLHEVHVSLKIPFTDIGVEGTWQPDESQREASWEMYVELVTRISVVALRPEDGMLREALYSLYSLFDTTRDILRRKGPTVAMPSGDNGLSFGFLAVFILNDLLRPVLAKWHPLLLDHESRRDPSTSPWEHEHGWAKSTQLREDLNAVRQVLTDYANILAQVAGVPQLT